MPLSRTGKSALQVATLAAEQAGRILAKYFHVHKQVKYKGRRNVVTDVDLLAERTIVTFLQQEFPEYSVLSEESRSITTDSNYTWIVDPLDGTNNYLFGIPFFSISLALTRKEEVLLGLVYDPVRRELFRAEKGKGAFLGARRLSVSRRADLQTSSIGCDMGYDEKEGRQILQTLSNLWPRLHSMRVMGSAALGLAYVACGRFDLYFHRCLFPWDLAGGILLVREAMGKVTDWEGEPADIHSTRVIAANESVHAEFLSLVKGWKVESPLA